MREQWTVFVEVDGQWSAEALFEELSAGLPPDIRLTQLEREHLTDDQEASRG